MLARRAWRSFGVDISAVSREKGTTSARNQALQALLSSLSRGSDDEKLKIAKQYAENDRMEQL